MNPTIGVEIRGIDLSKDISNQQFDEIHRAFAEHSVVFFKEQDRIPEEKQIALAKRFGELHVHPAAPVHTDHQEIFVIHTDKDSKIANGNIWHTDVSCDETPPLGTMLQLHLLPSNGGDTLFASMYAAYDALSDKMKEYLEGLTAIHDGNPNYHDRAQRDGRKDDRVFPRSEHPLIRTHPVSGDRKSVV